ncbi:MAG: hypothetical protein GPJ54_02560 [Candidatus Heimdallarchaeota archaeon]|nr:hypothetical protein [Candidatus Heimdallarchaeota archaeon]
MKYNILTYIALMGVILLLGTVQAQSENSLIYFSSELEVDYEYIWDEVIYTAPTFLSEGLIVEHNYTFTITKELVIDIASFADISPGSNVPVDYSIQENLYDYFIFVFDGVSQNDVALGIIDLPDTGGYIITIDLISNYILPVEILNSDGEVINQFDLLEDDYTALPDEEYVVDGDQVTYRLEQAGNTISKYEEKIYQYSTGLLLSSNVSTFGENGVISQTMMALRNNIESGFLPFPSRWVSIIGIIAIVGINKRKKVLTRL